MKKVFAILAISFVITACNNSSKETTTTTTDSITASESPLMDAVNTADSASKIIHDSIHHLVDSSNKK